MKQDLSSQKLARLTLPFLLIVGLGANAQPVNLDALLSAGRYTEANQAVRQMPTGKAITLLTGPSGPSQANSAPVQWLLADVYWRDGQQDKAIEWGYQALVSTQLDASICTYSTKTTAWMMQSYEMIFREARRRPHVQAKAIKQALAQHAQTHIVPADRRWACILGAHLDGHSDPSDVKVSSESTSQRRRRKELEGLIKKSGLDIRVDW